ncbi:MAG TPA: hypothetical protein VLM85_02570 [Polyangiaceae bacterium]|nr:hypothetical protein [Polyangiaceae bacterium]
MRRLPLAVLSLALGSGCASTAPRLAAEPSVLPLRTLRLYETGVGYFERSGPLPRADQPGLPVPAGHLDDALKTLVVLTPGGKMQVGGVEFGSSMSRGMARALAGLPQEGDAPVTYEALLQSMRGSIVEVRTAKGVTTGRLVHVEAFDAPVENKDSKDDSGKETKPARPERKLRLTLLTDHAEVVHYEGAELVSVRPTDPAQGARLDAALEALLSNDGQSRHALRLLGEPGAPVTLGYIAETPVWRTTYRLVVPREGKPVLQAWALLHNDTDESWNGVHVDLVNGRPDSFLFPLAAPRYAKRELITPQNELSTVPQLMSRTADTMWGDHVEDAEGAGGLGLSGYGEGGGGRGSGFGLGSIGTIGHGAGGGSSVGESSLLAVGDLASVAQATGVEAGALFVYGLPSTLSLRAHSSALVPFLQQPLDAERIAWVDPSASPVARAAVRFVNSTPQTLPPGTISFFADGGFSGESSIDRLKPGERRFITFGADLDVEARETGTPLEVENVQRLTFFADRVTEHFLRTRDAEWRVENRSGQPRSVYVALQLDRNATVSGADSADYDIAGGHPLIVVRVPGRQETTRHVKSVEGLARSQNLDALSAKRLAELATLPNIPATDRAVAQEASARMKDYEDTRTQLAAAREDLGRAEKDLARYRDDAKAIGDRGALAQPLVTRMVTAEDQVGVQRRKIDDLEKESTRRKEAVRTVLARLARG